MKLVKSQIANIVGQNADAELFIKIAEDTKKSFNQRYYNPDESILVSFQNGPNNPLDWIGMYKQGETPGVETSTDWEYVNGSSGSVTLQVSDPGEYFISLFANDGYTEITDRVKVYVISIPEVNTSNPEYGSDEQIVVNYSNAPSLMNDWIGIYKVRDIPGTIGSTDWDYVSGQSGSVTLNSLAGGYYFANYFLLNAYAEPGERAYFTVGDDLAVVSTNKSAYTSGESITIYLQNGPGLSEDHIKIFKLDEENPVDSLDVKGLQSGRFTYSGTLDTSSYYLSLFMNGSGHEISNRVEFRVQTEVVSSESSLAEKSLSVYPSPGHGRVHIDLNNTGEAILAIRVTSLTGKLVLSQDHKDSPGRKSTSIDLSGNKPGIYMISVITAESSMTRKVVLH